MIFSLFPVKEFSGYRKNEKREEAELNTDRKKGDGFS